MFPKRVILERYVWDNIHMQGGSLHETNNQSISNSNYDSFLDYRLQQ